MPNRTGGSALAVARRYMHVTSAMMKRKNIQMSGPREWFVDGVQESRVINLRSVVFATEDWWVRREEAVSGKVGKGQEIKYG
jgi:hypothetical protein